MKIHLALIDYELWGIVKEGYKSSKNKDGNVLSKTKWTDIYKKAKSINTKAIILFYYTLDCYEII